MKHAVLFIALAAGGAAASAADSDMILTEDGVVRVRIGMRLQDLQNAVRERLYFEYDPLLAHACGTVSAKSSRTTGISYTVDDGIVIRISIDAYGDGPHSAVRTDAGIGLGATEEEVKQAYGSRLVVQPHPDDPTWHYLVVDSPDRKNAIVFETNGTKVTHFRVGSYPSITRPNGCI